MSNIVYSTDSDEHLVNTGEKSEPQWCELTNEEMKQDLMDSWEMYDRLDLIRQRNKV